MTWIVGLTPSGEWVPRQSTGHRDWDKAEAFRQSYIKTALVEIGHGPLIPTSVELYMASRSDISDRTKKEYVLMFERLIKHCAKNNVFHMGDLKVDLLERFKTEGLPAMEDTSKKNVVDRLRQFLKTAYEREWIKEALHLKVKVVKCTTNMKSPYEEDEVMRMLAGTLELKLTKYAQFPKTTRLLLELMLETGMRVGDACLFDPRVCVKGERSQIYTFEPQKQKKKVSMLKSVDVFVSRSLFEAITQAKADGEWYSKNLPFVFPHAKDEYYIGHVAYEAMRYVGKISGVEDCRPHRLRDTCAVALLEGSNRACTRSGPKPPVSVDNVSKLLAHHSVAVTERYYSKWTKTRRLNLERAIG